MSYFNIAQEGHLVNVVAPVDWDTAAVTGDAFSMENWSHASIIIQLGVTGAAATITVAESDDAAGTTTTDIAFKYAAEATGSGDTLGALTACAATGFATGTGDSIMYVIEIDAADLSEGYPWIIVSITDPGASTLGSVVAVLSGGRYAGDQSATAIA